MQADLPFFFFKVLLFIYTFIYLLLAVLGFVFVRAFSSCSEQGLLFVAVRRLLIAVACLCCRAQALGMWASIVVARALSSCGSWALERSQ